MQFLDAEEWKLVSVNVKEKKILWYVEYLILPFYLRMGIPQCQKRYKNSIVMVMDSLWFTWKQKGYFHCFMNNSKLFLLNPSTCGTEYTFCGDLCLPKIELIDWQLGIFHLLKTCHSFRNFSYYLILQPTLCRVLCFKFHWCILTSHFVVGVFLSWSL